jgi:hypothetical protein
MSQTHRGPDGQSTPSAAPNRSASTPRWVKVFVLIAIILVVLFVIMHLTGNGFGDHMHMLAIGHGVHHV